LSLIKHVILKKIVAHDFQYDLRIYIGIHGHIKEANYISIIMTSWKINHTKTFSEITGCNNNLLKLWKWYKELL
jgi:hypothetical protein